MLKSQQVPKTLIESFPLSFKYYGLAFDLVSVIPTVFKEGLIKRIIYFMKLYFGAL